MQPEILYEDNHLIAVNKPTGILTQQDYSKQPSLMDHVKKYIKEKYNKPGNVFLGMVHRLDKGVSGVVVFARTSKAASRLSKQFRERNIKKIYLALTHRNKTCEKPALTRLQQYLVRKRGISVIETGPGQNAHSVTLEYQTVTTNSIYALQLVHLVSGKKHQIRTQLASIGIPIVGDRKYLSTEHLKQVYLHAYCMVFEHPTTKKIIKIVADIPVYIHKKLIINDKIIEEIFAIIDTIKSE